MRIGIKILVIARADVLRDGLQTMLAGLLPGAKIDLLDDGSQTTNQVRQKEYDLIFLYPGLGFETLLSATRAIKTAATRAFTIMVIEEQDQVRKALEAGADQVLLKGFSAVQLITILRGFQIEKPFIDSRQYIF
jgi:DNA-binding NarL/FixJ family response regulator